MNAISHQDKRLLAMGDKLVSAAEQARLAIEAIPENISVENEIAAINAVSANAQAIAERISTMRARTEEGAMIKANAQRWLAGSYFSGAAA
jgi:hypothetical protein